MKTFEEYRETFREFYELIAKSHRESQRPHRGHGLDHDVTVAQIAAQIAPNAQIAEKAWCAGMPHSIDRMIERGNTVLVEETIRNILSFLPFA